MSSGLSASALACAQQRGLVCDQKTQSHEPVGARLAIATNHADQPQAPEALYNAAFTALEIKKYDEALKHTAAFEEKFASHKLLPLPRLNAATGRASDASACVASLMLSREKQFFQWGSTRHLFITRERSF